MKYFNKDFFKFTFGFLIIVAISLLIISAVSAYAAGVEKFVFVTDPQTIKPNILSGPLTIQAQDSNSSSIQTTETIDLEFVSSSPTGEFLGSSGAPATKTMNKNTANRTFYYRDSTEGTFTITVNGKGRDTGIELTTKQTITISSGAISSASSDDDEQKEDEENDNNISSLSSTSGPVSVNYSTPSSSLEVSFGGERLTTTGSPITFQAFVKKNSSSNNSLIFDWSFGDGAVGSGALVTHTYKYPGDYVVVLNSRSGNNFSVSRIKIKVIEPNISLKKESGYVEIINNSNYEINLFNWKITSDGMGFVFQPDTIILPKSKMILDNRMLSMKGEVFGETILKNSLGNEVVKINDPIKKEEIAEIEKSLVEIKNKTVGIIDMAIDKKLVKEKSPISILATNNNQLAPSAEPEVLGVSISTTTTTEGVSNVIYEAPQKKNFIARIFTAIVGLFD